MKKLFIYTGMALCLLIPGLLRGQEIGLLRVNPDSLVSQREAAIWGGFEEGRFKPVHGALTQWSAGAGVKSFTIVGSTKEVSIGIENQLKKYASVSRISGTNAYERSIAVAKKYFPGYQKHINLASGENFADALAGGPLALEKAGPLILANDNTTVVERIKAYAKAANTTQATVYGGTVWISDAAVRMILQMD